MQTLPTPNDKEMAVAFDDTKVREKEASSGRSPWDFGPPPKRRKRTKGYQERLEKLYFAIYSLVSDHGPTWVTNKWISQYSKRSIGTASNMVRDLCLDGRILCSYETKRTPSGGVKTYRTFALPAADMYGPTPPKVAIWRVKREAYIS